MEGGQSRFTVLGERGLKVDWTLGDGSQLHLLANLGEQSIAGVSAPSGEVLFAGQEGLLAGSAEQILPPWSVLWLLEEPEIASMLVTAGALAAPPDPVFSFSHRA